MSLFTMETFSSFPHPPWVSPDGSRLFGLREFARQIVHDAIGHLRRVDGDPKLPRAVTRLCCTRKVPLKVISYVMCDQLSLLEIHTIFFWQEAKSDQK